MSENTRFQPPQEDLEGVLRDATRNVALPSDVELAYTTRSGTVDCVHRGSVVVVDRSGAVVFAAGDPERLVFERSVTKPFKAVRLVQSGAAAAFGFGDIDLALAAGSHSGSTKHIRALRAMATKLGLDEGALLCGEPLPIGVDALFEFARGRGTRLSALHCDCSGEHLGVLALSLHMGWPVTQYTHGKHPAHKYYREYIDDLMCHKTESIHEPAVDGCGLPMYPVPLVAIARGFGTLADQSTRVIAVQDVWAAVVKEPYFFGGKDRFDSVVVSASRGGILCKCGAEGVYAVGVREGAFGLAVKVADGNHRGAQGVVINILTRFGLLPVSTAQNLRRRFPGHLLNNRGEKVGDICSLL